MFHSALVSAYHDLSTLKMWLSTFLHQPTPLRAFEVGGGWWYVVTTSDNELMRSGNMRCCDSTDYFPRSSLHLDWCNVFTCIHVCVLSVSIVSHRLEFCLTKKPVREYLSPFSGKCRWRGILTYSTLFILWQLKLSFLYPGTTGRNFDEVLRVVDSLQLASRHRIATPANWQKGESVVISPSLTDAEAKKQFPQGWETVNLPSGKPYLRITFAE